MKTTLKASLMIAAAIAGLSFSAGQSMAQQRVGGDGHALDANNRIGSGGTNAPTQQPTNLSNQIATGRVTGLFGFQGRDAVPDPTSFRGGLPSERLDRFNAVSAGNSNTLAPYYSTSATVAPPSGFVRSTDNNSFVQAPPPTILRSDLRLENALYNSIPVIPGPGELSLPGPVDPTANRGMITASPLYGVRQWTPDQQRAAEYLFASQTPVGAEEPGTPSQNRIDEIRRDLQIVPTNAPGQSDRTNNGAVAPDNGQAMFLPPLTSGATPLAPPTAGSGSGNFSTNESNRQAVPAAVFQAPEKQSTQYQALLKNLRQLEAAPVTDQDANRKFNETLKQIKDMRAHQQNAPKLPARPTTNPSGAIAPAPARAPAPSPAPAAVPVEPVKPATPAPAPLTIKSIADGINNQGLKDLLTKAESEITQKRYAKAIDLYDSAAEAAPNNPLIVIGRANAELAGAYYRQAEADIRGAFAKDHAVLMAQFNLSELFGAARLEYVTKDLITTAANSPENPTAVFLLAYISYNSAEPQKARVYLNEADKRTGGKDEVITLMKKYWTLTDKAPAKEEKANEPVNVPEMTK